MKHFLPFCIGAVSAVALSGCASDPRYDDSTLYLTEGGGIISAPHPQRSQPQRANFDNVSYWDGDGVSGSPRIVVSLGEQRAYFYKGNHLVGVSALSTGREGWDTVTGKFRIIQKSKDHVSNLFGNYVDATTGEIVMKDVDTRKDKKPPGTVYDGAKMPYFMRVVGGTGLHAGFLPGYPASHGCIRMPEFMAETFFNNVSVGTPVEITN